jgi:hypothetical protein
VLPNKTLSYHNTRGDEVVKQSLRRGRTTEKLQAGGADMPEYGMSAIQNPGVRWSISALLLTCITWLLFIDRRHRKRRDVCATPGLAQGADPESPIQNRRRGLAEQAVGVGELVWNIQSLRAMRQAGAAHLTGVAALVELHV